MKVVVDYDECEANGICVATAPEMFELDDDDNLSVLLPEVPPELEDRVREAVDGCPKRALFLKESAE